MENEHDAWLDGLLARAQTPAASPALERRILGDFDRLSTRWSLARTLRRLSDAVWPGAPLWQPAAALALALAVGAGVAAIAPLDFALADEGAAFALDAPADLDLGQEA